MSDSCVRVGLVFPELLGTYGDRGNALVLVQRAKWRGIDAELVEVRAGAPIPDSLDIYLLGGGEDAPQLAASRGLRASAAAIDRARANGAVVLAICAGFQLIGTTYVDAEGTVLDGLVWSTSPPDRARLAASASVWLSPTRRSGCHS